MNEFLAPNRFAKSSNQEKDLVAGEISYKAISPLPWVQSLFQLKSISFWLRSDLNAYLDLEMRILSILNCNEYGQLIFR